MIVDQDDVGVHARDGRDGGGERGGEPVGFRGLQRQENQERERAADPDGPAGGSARGAVARPRGRAPALGREQAGIAAQPVQLAVAPAVALEG